MRTLYIECVSGIAGDMFASAFLDAGLISRQEVEDLPRRIGWPDVKIEVSSVVRATMKATSIDVSAQGESWKQSLKESASAPIPSGKIEIRGKAHEATHSLSARPVHSDGGAGSPLHNHMHGDSHGHTHGHSHGGTHANADGWHTQYADLDRFLATRDLPIGVIEKARSIFYNLGRAEAEAHGMAIEYVAFHEVGAYDSIIDVLLAAICIDRIGVDQVECSSIPVGRGMIQIAHGLQPVPPPASANLLRGMPVAPVPIAIQKENVELATPTGLAILKTLEPRFRWDWPSGILENAGMGAGHMDFPGFPNVVRIGVFSSGVAADSSNYAKETICQLTFNVDDQTGEEAGRFIDRAMKEGALDIQVIPATGKKGRPSMVIQLLAREEQKDRMIDLVLRNTRSFGVRVEKVERYRLETRFEERDVQGSKVKYRIGTNPAGAFIKEKPEFDDLP